MASWRCATGAKTSRGIWSERHRASPSLDKESAGSIALLEARIRSTLSQHAATTPTDRRSGLRVFHRRRPSPDGRYRPRRVRTLPFEPARSLLCRSIGDDRIKAFAAEERCRDRRYLGFLALQPATSTKAEARTWSLARLAASPVAICLRRCLGIRRRHGDRCKGFRCTKITVPRKAGFDEANRHGFASISIPLPGEEREKKKKSGEPKAWVHFRNSLPTPTCAY